MCSACLVLWVQSQHPQKCEHHAGQQGSKAKAWWCMPVILRSCLRKTRKQQNQPLCCLRCPLPLTLAAKCLLLQLPTP